MRERKEERRGREKRGAVTHINAGKEGKKYIKERKT